MRWRVTQPATRATAARCSCQAPCHLRARAGQR